MTNTIAQLASTINSASYIDTFFWFFMLMPLMVALPLVIYGIILSAVTFIRSLL